MRPLLLSLRVGLVFSFLLVTVQCARAADSLVTLQCTGRLVVNVESQLAAGLQGVKVELVAQKFDINGSPIGSVQRLEKAPDQQGVVTNSWQFKLDIGDRFSVQAKAISPSWHDYMPSQTVHFDWSIYDKIIDAPLDVTRQITLKLSSE
jgi:hypothetical protein